MILKVLPIRKDLKNLLHDVCLLTTPALIQTAIFCKIKTRIRAVWEGAPPKCNAILSSWFYQTSEINYSVEGVQSINLYLWIYNNYSEIVSLLFLTWTNKFIIISMVWLLQCFFHLHLILTLITPRKIIIFIFGFKRSSDEYKGRFNKLIYF